MNNTKSNKSHPHTAEAKAKISAARLGTVVSDVVKAKISATKKGRPMSEAHKAAISRAKRKACPHCGYLCSKTDIAEHFDNCVNRDETSTNQVIADNTDQSKIR